MFGELGLVFNISQFFASDPELEVFAAELLLKVGAEEFPARLCSEQFVEADIGRLPFQHCVFCQRFPVVCTDLRDLRKYLSLAPRGIMCHKIFYHL